MSWAMPMLFLTWLTIMLGKLGKAIDVERAMLVQYGKPRTATTFQYQILRAATCVKYGRPAEVRKVHKIKNKSKI